jgi:hypothetical protein
MQRGSESGEPAAHRQACFPRFPRQPERADLLVQSENRSTVDRAHMSFATKHGVQQQRFGKAIFDPGAERGRTTLNAAFDVTVEHQRFEPERMSYRAHRQSAVGKLQKLKCGNGSGVLHGKNPFCSGTPRFYNPVLFCSQIETIYWKDFSADP